MVHINTTMSDVSSPVSNKSTPDIEDMILDEPMYYILAQFFETHDGKNIATLLQELTTEVKALRETIKSSSLQSSS